MGETLSQTKGLEGGEAEVSANKSTDQRSYDLLKNPEWLKKVAELVAKVVKDGPNGITGDEDQTILGEIGQVYRDQSDQELLGAQIQVMKALKRASLALVAMGVSTGSDVEGSENADAETASIQEQKGGWGRLKAAIRSSLSQQ